jgi:hypothetical protein
MRMRSYSCSQCFKLIAFCDGQQTAVTSHHRKSKRSLRVAERKKNANQCIIVLVSTVELIAGLILTHLEV